MKRISINPPLLAAPFARLPLMAFWLPHDMLKHR